MADECRRDGCREPALWHGVCASCSRRFVQLAEEQMRRDQHNMDAQFLARYRQLEPAWPQAARAPVHADSYLDPRQFIVGLWQARPSEVPSPEGCARRAAAAKKARDLLVSHLTPKQRSEFEARAYFHVVGCESGSRYRIGSWHTNNVTRMGEHETEIERLCFGPADMGMLEIGDVMLAQKTALELYESVALCVARRSAVTMRSAERGHPVYGYSIWDT